jgi:membrane associated rhomboid family serine protease
MIARIPARSRRQAMDWSLALISQGIEATIDHADDIGWGLFVAEHEEQQALAIIRQYRVENLRWPWRQKIHSEILFDWGSLIWVVLIGLFFWLDQREDLERVGLMDGAAVSHGEWWRLFTAIFLHADAAHLTSNAVFGLVLLGLAMGRYGTGVGLLAAFLAGAGGNVATWLVYRDHHSLGASGMVMGSLGLLAAQTLLFARKNPPPLKYTLSGVIAGGLLFVLLGLSPGTDVLAHLGGFISGLLIGCLLLFFPRCQNRGAVNLLAGLVFAFLAVCAWWLALRSIRPA